MSPIRVGMIGLSARAKTSWASTAHLPYLLQAPEGKYIIIALCNSSVSAAQAAIEAYSLPASTKAYGNPDDLAHDQEIDLVVCNTRVDVHYETIKPSLQSGKNVYCEWPLASNLEAAEELNALAKKHGSRTMIGLQGELSPITLKLKSMIEQEDKIGKILSSTVIACGGTRTRDGLIEGLKYFTQKNIGGNMVTIGFGHTIDLVATVLGEISSFNSQLSIQRSRVAIIGSDGKVTETVTTDVADHIMLQGTLTTGAPLSVTYRRGPPFKGTPGLIWFIHGERGEIQVTSAGAGIHANTNEVSITIHDFDTDTIGIEQWDPHFTDLPLPARNVAAMYEAFANGDTEKHPDFGHAVLRHRQIEEIFKSSEETRRGVYL